MGQYRTHVKYVDNLKEMIFSARYNYSGDGKLEPFNPDLSDDPEQYELDDHVGEMSQAFIRHSQKVSKHLNSNTFSLSQATTTIFPPKSLKHCLN